MLKKILVIKPSSFGDIVHALQVTDSLIKQLGNVKVDWVVGDAFAPLLENYDGINSIVFKRRGGIKSFFSLIKEIRKKEYDLVLDFQGLARSGIFTFFAKSKRKIGRKDAREGATFFYKEKVDLPKNSLHAVDILKKFLAKIDLDEKLFAPLALRIKEEWPYEFAKNKFVLLFPNSRRKEKDWPHFRELSKEISDDYNDVSVVWAGSEPYDVPEFLEKESRFYSLIGKTSIKDLINLVYNAKVVIANDSGPMHLAAALEKKILTFFGPTDPEKAGPYPIDSYRHKILKSENISDISVRDASIALSELIL